MKVCKSFCYKYQKKKLKRVNNKHNVEEIKNIKYIILVQISISKLVMWGNERTENW